MTKKIGKILVIAIIVFCAITLLNAVYAKQLDSLNELGNEILAVNPDAESAYVVGNYVFTSAHKLTTQDVMLAARSINVVDVDGKINTDDIYGEMTIYTIVGNFDSNGNVTSWTVSNNLVGTTEWNLSNMDIIYIDYNQTATVIFDYGYDNKIEKVPVVLNSTVAEPTAPTRDGYVFKGWFLGNDEYDFSTQVTSEITLKAKWALDVEAIVENTIENINPGKYDVTIDEHEATVIVKLDALRESITLGGSGAVTGLKEALENADIETLTVIADDGSTLTVNKDTAVSVIRDWIQNLFPGVSIDSITNGDFANKTFTVKVNLKDGILSTNGNSVETYTLSIIGEKEIDVDEYIENATAGVNAEKYDVEFDASTSTVTVTVQNVAREELITAGGSNIGNTFNQVLSDGNIESIVVRAGGTELKVNGRTSINTIKTWLASYFGKNANEIKNEDLYNKEFSVEVNLAADVISENGNKVENYTVKFALEDYQEVDVDILVGGAVEKVNNDLSNKYIATLENNVATITVKDEIRDQQIGLEVLSTFKANVLTPDVKSIEVSGASNITIDNTTSLNEVRLWIGSLGITTNEGLAGKEFSVKVNMADSSISANGNKIENYTVKFAVEPKTADVSAIQSTAVAVINTTAFDVDIQNNKINVALSEPTAYASTAVSGSGAKTAMKKFLESEGIASIEFVTTGNTEGVRITKADAQDNTTLENKAIEMANILFPGESLGIDTKLEVLDGINVKIKINFEAGYKVADGQYSEYIMSFAK